VSEREWWHENNTYIIWGSRAIPNSMKNIGFPFIVKSKWYVNSDLNYLLQDYLMKDAFEWILENLNKDFLWDHHGYFYFKNKEDAVKFKLVWG